MAAGAGRARGRPGPAPGWRAARSLAREHGAGLARRGRGLAPGARPAGCWRSAAWPWTGRAAAVGGARPGSGLSEEPVFGVGAGHAGGRAVPRVPSRAAAADGAGRVGPHLPVEGVADLAFERAQRLFGDLALGYLLVVVRAALGVPVADLGDRGHVDGVVQPPVPAQRQPVDDAAARGHFDRGGAVIGGEPVRAGEAGDVADIADHRGGHGGPDPEDLSRRGAAGPDRDGQLPLGIAPLGVDVTGRQPGPENARISFNCARMAAGQS